jgi:serine/threonine protein kinase
MGKPSQLQPGQMVGPYRIVRKVGSGGMGEVYEASEEELRRPVAIKILSPDALSDKDMVNRFKNEGRALARIKHRNVVGLYTLGEYDGRAYMAMEFVDGMSVDEYFEKHPCGLREIVDFFRQMLEGLACAHEAGVTHRDIKPQNIIIDKNMNCKIIDFGIAKVASEVQTVQTAANVVVGTANYLAPEIVTGSFATGQSDIYSLGVVFYTILTSHTPFRGRTNLEVLEKIRSDKILFNRREDVILPDDIKQLIFKMTAKNPLDRYTSARSALADLNKIRLDRLPPEFLLPTMPRLLLENRDEVLGKCKAHGFETSEIRLIVNLAINIDTKRDEARDPDATEKIIVSPSIRLSPRAVDEAIQRYLMARSKLISRRIPINRTAETARSARYIPRSWPVILVSVLVSLVYVLYLRHSPGLPEVTQETQSSMVAEAQPQPQPQPASAPSPGTDAKAKPAPATATAKKKNPMFVVGDTFKVSCQSFENGIKSGQSTEQWTLKEIKNGRLKYVDGYGGEMIRSERVFTPPFEVANSRRSPDFSNAYDTKATLFPLHVGGAAKYHVKGGGSTGNMNWEFNWSCRVASEDKVSAPAGLYPAFKVICDADSGPLRSQSYYFAPEARHWLRMETARRNGLSETCELVSFKFGQ